MKNELKKYERILNLYSQLCTGGIIYKEKEAQRYGVTERSIQRDIDSLRAYFADNLVYNNDGQYDLIYDRKQKGYRLVSKKRQFVSGKELLPILKILLGSKGLSREELYPILENILRFPVAEEEKRKIKAMVANEMLNYKGPAHSQRIKEKIWDISEAVYHQNYLRIRYKKLLHEEMVERTVIPLGVLFSEHYFYMLALIESDKVNKGNQSPTIYRIDRIMDLDIAKRHFALPYSMKLDDYQFREKSPFMFGGDVKRIKFWYSGPSLEVILDKIPTAKILQKQDEKYLLSADVIGEGAEMWLRSQGKYVEVI